MMVTGGNITRIAEQLLAEGLITRSVAPGDRRASIVKLSAAGRRAFAEMARRHEELDRRDVRRPGRGRAQPALRAARQAERHLNALESDDDAR